MVRIVAVVGMLALATLLAAWATFAMYDLAAIYGDTTGSDLRNLEPFGGIAVAMLGLITGLVCAAVVIARGRAKAIVRAVAVGLVVLSVIGILAANHFGLEAKRDDTARSSVSIRSY